MIANFLKKPSTRLALIFAILWGVPMSFFYAWHLKSQGRLDSFLSFKFAVMLLIFSSGGVLNGLWVWYVLKRRSVTR